MHGSEAALAFCAEAQPALRLRTPPNQRAQREDRAVETKMIIAVIPEEDADGALDALRERSFRVTRIASSAGLLRKGNATLLMGLPEWRVDEAVRLLREHCGGELEGVAGSSGLVYAVATDRFEQLS
jgi:uncharacterized protein YaaQ